MFQRIQEPQCKLFHLIGQFNEVITVGLLLSNPFMEFFSNLTRKTWITVNSLSKADQGSLNLFRPGFFIVLWNRKRGWKRLEGEVLFLVFKL